MRSHERVSSREKCFPLLLRGIVRLIQDYLGEIPKLSSQLRCYHSGMKNLGTWNDVACLSPEELEKGFASGL